MELTRDELALIKQALEFRDFRKYDTHPARLEALDNLAQKIGA